MRPALHHAIVRGVYLPYNLNKHPNVMKQLLALAPICALLLTTACTQSPQKLVAAGNRYHDKKKFSEASILYQKAITKDKTNSEAYYRQGLNLLDMNDPVNAAKYLRRAIDLKPSNSDAETKLAEIYLSAYSSNPRKFKTLLSEISDLDQKILQQNPNSFDGFRLRGLYDLAQNDRDKALESFGKANQIKPHSPDLVWWYAETLSAAGRVPEAEALVRDTLSVDPKWGRGYDFLFVLYGREKNPEKAEAVLRERVQKDPTSLLGLENLAGYLIYTHRYPEAEAMMKRVLDNPTAFPTRHEALGDFYFRAQKYDQALQQFQLGLKEDGKNALHYNERLIAVYEKTGRDGDAQQLAKGLVDKNPKDTTTNELYAGLLLQNLKASTSTQSLNELRTLVQNSPTDGAVHLDLARAYFGTRQPDKALTEALDAMQYEAKRQSPRAGVMLNARLIAGTIYEDRGQHANALEQAGLILQMEPNNPNGRLVRDRALMGTNQFADAQPDLEALVKQYPKFTDAHLQLANLYLNQRQFDKASAEFELVWKSTPPDSRGFIGLQTVKLAEGKADDATHAIETLVQQNPRDLNLRYQLAGFETTAGGQAIKADPARAKQLFGEAADNYKEIIKTTSNSADVWLRLGILQRQLGQYDAALASFEQAANADPHNSAAVLNQAMLLEAVGKKKEAVTAYTKVLGMDPENALALNNLAFMNAETGTNLDQAMTFAERAKKKVPNSPDISDTLGYVYFQKNLNNEALTIFRQVVQEEPQNPTFHFHLAMALRKQGDRQAARDEANKALKAASQPDEQNRIRSFLNEIG